MIEIIVVALMFIIAYLLVIINDNLKEASNANKEEVKKTNELLAKLIKQNSLDNKVEEFLEIKTSFDMGFVPDDAFKIYKKIALKR